MRSAFAKFRTASHTLEIELGRHLNSSYNLRFCKLCLTVNKYLEVNEYRVLLECPFDEKLRNIYLDFFMEQINHYSCIQLLSSKDDVNAKIAVSVTNMFKLRKCYVQFD